MSTPSTLLLCAGAASSLAAVWTLAGFSESSASRFSTRILGAAGIGIVVPGLVFARAAAEVRSELALSLLFSLASAAALTLGAAKIEGALEEKDGPRVVRRSGGIVLGSWLGMAAVGAAALDLAHSSLAHARAGWAMMLGPVLAALIVFAERARYAGAGTLALGGRMPLLGLVALALPAAARLSAASLPHEPAPAAPSMVIASAALPPEPAVDVTATPSAAAPSAAAPSAIASGSDVAASVAAPNAAAPSGAAPSAAIPSAAGSASPGEVQIEGVVARGMLEADVRGGVERRKDRLQACRADAKNAQSGALTLKIGIDASGSVTFSRATAGDLLGTPLAACWLPAFYKMGFAAPAASSAGNAGFDITLRAP